MQNFLNLFKPYFTFILFLLPVITMLLIPVFEKLIKKAGAMAGFVFSFFYLFLLPFSAFSSNVMSIGIPVLFVLAAFIISYLQRQYPQFDSFWYSLLAFVLFYILLTIIGFLFFYEK